MADGYATVRLTERERNVVAYALAFYAAELDRTGADVGYTGPLETAPEVREIEDRLRRASLASDNASAPDRELPNDR